MMLGFCVTPPLFPFGFYALAFVRKVVVVNTRLDIHYLDIVIIEVSKRKIFGRFPDNFPNAALIFFGLICDKIGGMSI